MKNVLIILTIIILIIAGFYFYKSNFANLTSKIAECPDEKIINRMPGSGESSYYIKDSARKEISDYDSQWVETNCNIPTQTVY
jgi:hypothetical protein